MGMQLEVIAQASLLRKKYWDRFCEIGLPKTGQEAFRYLHVKHLQVPQTARKVGATATKLSDPCIVLSLDEAMKTYSFVLQNRLSKELKAETDPFALLSGAVYQGGWFIYIPPGRRAQIHLCFESASEGLSAYRLQVFLGKGAELEVSQELAGAGFAIEHFDAVLDAGARLKLAHEIRLEENSLFFRSLRFALKRDALLDCFSYLEGTRTVRQSLKASLLEEGAEVDLKGLSRLSGQRESHTHVLVEHLAPYTRSRQHFKKVLEQASRSSFEGKIYVGACAQKTEAYQLSENLLLSDTAVAYAKPNLEIFADDVRASHGATFSQFNEEELFYLRSRGLSAPAAKEMLLQGFCQGMIQSIPIKRVREKFVI